MGVESERGWGGSVSARPSMTDGAAAFKARGPSNFLRKSVPPRPLRGAGRRPGGPDSHIAARLGHAVLNQEDQQQEALMSMISHMEAAANDAYLTLILELEAEFGSTETAGLAARFIDAEAADFYWDARQIEKHLGAYESLDDEGGELERVKIIGVLNARWFVATCIVDGDGQVHALVKLSKFTSAWDADEAFCGNG